jgi:hypothetical protein
LQRRDHWVRWLEILAAAVYWWHPVVWWARRELREAEEQCCDAWVVWALPGTGRTYATALVECLDFLSVVPGPLPVGASGVGHVNDLKRRLTMILSGTTPRHRTWAGTLALLAVGVLLPVLPTFADGDKRPETRRTGRKPDDRPRGDADAKRQGNEQDVNQARVEVEKLRAEMQAQMARMRMLEARLAEAQRRLEQAAGHGDEKMKGKRIGIVIVGADGKQKIEWITDPRMLERLMNKGGETRRIEMRFEGDRAFPTVQGWGLVAPKAEVGGRTGGGPRNLEQKLDQLMREVEDLRRQMRGNGPRDRRPEGAGDRRPEDRRDRQPQGDQRRPDSRPQGDNVRTAPRRGADERPRD